MVDHDFCVPSGLLIADSERKHQEDQQPCQQPRQLPGRRCARGIVPLDVPRQHDPEHQDDRHRTDIDQHLQGRQELGLEQHEQQAIVKKNAIR